eukprot:2320581-Rhodomonas_salina.2
MPLLVHIYRHSSYGQSYAVVRSHAVCSANRTTSPSPSPRPCVITNLPKSFLPCGTTQPASLIRHDTLCTDIGYAGYGCMAHLLRPSSVLTSGMGVRGSDVQLPTCGNGHGRGSNVSVCTGQRHLPVHRAGGRESVRKEEQESGREGGGGREGGRKEEEREGEGGKRERERRIRSGACAVCAHTVSSSGGSRAEREGHVPRRNSHVLRGFKVLC